MKKKSPPLPALVLRAGEAYELAWFLLAASERFGEAMREVMAGNLLDAHWYLHWGGFVEAPKRRRSYPGTSQKKVPVRPSRRRRKRAA